MKHYKGWDNFKIAIEVIVIEFTNQNKLGL